MRYLRRWDWRDRALVRGLIGRGAVACGYPDCLVGLRSDDGSTVKAIPCPSDRLRPLTAEEMAEVERANGGGQP